MIATLVMPLLLAVAPQSDPEKQSTGWQQWKQGQAALQNGETDKAVNLFEESLAKDAKLTRNYLSLAAAWLDRNDEPRACLYLALYVAAHPEHASVRFQYVDLLQRLKRTGEAREELERFVADVQEQSTRADEHLVHCHSRLMQIAESNDNTYEAHLNRGIGLYLLARQSGLESEDVELGSPQAMLCRAAAELTLAARVRPEEARPYFYLHRVWSSLEQSQPASRSLRSAESTAPFSYLTSAEQRQLKLTCRQRECDGHSGRR